MPVARQGIRRQQAKHVRPWDWMGVGEASQRKSHHPAIRTPYRKRLKRAQKGLATPVTVQAAAILGQNPRQVCLQSPRPTSRRILKSQPSERPPLPPLPRAITTLQPARAKHRCLLVATPPNSVRGL